MIYIYIENKDFYRQIKYVFDNIFFILGTDCRYINGIFDIFRVGKDDIIIAYLDKLNERHILLSYFKNMIIIYNSGKLFGSSYLKPGSVPTAIKRYCWLNIKNIDNIISIYNSGGEPYVEKSFFQGKKAVRTNIDIISDIFFMLTRYEELMNKELSERETYKRFPGRESINYRNNFIERPVVNEDIELIWSWIKGFNIQYIKKNWWGSKEYAAFISHDVDMLLKYKSLKNLVRPTFELIKNKKFRKTFLNFGTYLSSRINYKKDPYWTFDYIIDKEKSMGIDSSFYFMSGGTSRLDNKYSINNLLTKGLIKHLEEKNTEVGYHASFNSYNDYSMMKKEKGSLDEIVACRTYGCRQHYLRFEVPLTWRIQEKSGLLYDTSMEFADCIGFRCGTCFPYKPYDLLENRVIEIWEIPLIIMDISLLNKSYNSLNCEEAYLKSIEIINRVKMHKGVLSLLWHNSSLDPYDYSFGSWEYLYEKIMGYIGESSCLGIDGRSLIMLLLSNLREE